MKNWIQNRDTNKALMKLDNVVELIPKADALSLFQRLTEAYSEAQVTKREITKIEAQKEIVRLEITKKYDFYHEVFERIFDERKTAITKSFEIIDKGLNEGDKDLISMGLQSLSKIVSSSPFANMQSLSNALEGNNPIEI